MLQILLLLTALTLGAVAYLVAALRSLRRQALRRRMHKVLDHLSEQRRIQK
jgi:hypothetical protein